MDQWEKELKLCFLDEAKQFLDDCEKGFLSLDSDRENPETLDKLFRLAHNLKGTSRAVGFIPISEFTHELESLLSKIKSKSIQITDETVTVLLQSNDCLRKMVSELKSNFELVFDNEELLNKIKILSSGQKLQSAIKSEAIVKETVTESHIVRGRRTVNSEESIRVNLLRLEKLNNSVGELVILQTVLSQHRHEIISPLLLKTITQLSKITKEIQDISMGLRMVPLKQTFQKLQRVVRDTAVTLNKEVELSHSGDDTEIDKTVLEYLSDPLIHIVRNAVDHGLETKFDRLQIGKSHVGKISLSAFHRGSHLVIEIQDDGKGLDVEKIKTKAIEKGLMAADEKLSNEEIYQFIFAQGFSTRTDVSEISGRGVGLDVVKTNIEKMSGEIQIETEFGKGTLFRLFFPLTLAIIEALIVAVGDATFVIPLNHVNETLRPVAKDINSITGQGDVLNLRGETLPMYRLSEILRQNGPKKSSQDSIALIVKNRKSGFAVLVDSIIRQQQVVIKQLGQEIHSHGGLVGSAILGNGRPAMILDLNELVETVFNRSPIKGVA